MPVELPEEVWGVVLGRVRDVRDWGQIQQINKTFHALVAAHCWSRVRQIRVDPRSVSIDGQDLVLSVKRRLLLLQLATSATKLTRLELTQTDPAAYQPGKSQECVLHLELIGEFLGLLAKKELKKVKELRLLWLSLSIPVVQGLVPFLLSVRSTLKGLDLGGVRVSALPPELFQAFRACSSLERIYFRFEPLLSMGYRGRDATAMMRKLAGTLTELAQSVISGKPNLCSLTLASSAFLDTRHLASIVVDSGAKLTNLTNLTLKSCNWAPKWVSFFEHYAQVVRRRQLTASHPLLTLENLHLDFYFKKTDHIPWELCPQLHLLSFSALADKVLPFLYRKFIQECHSVHCEQKEICCFIGMLFVEDRSHIGQSLIARIQSLVPCQAIEEEENEKIVLIKYNTIFNILIGCYDKR